MIRIRKIKNTDQYLAVFEGTDKDIFTFQFSINIENLIRFVKFIETIKGIYKTSYIDIKYHPDLDIVYDDGYLPFWN